MSVCEQSSKCYSRENKVCLEFPWVQKPSWEERALAGVFKAMQVCLYSCSRVSIRAQVHCVRAIAGRRKQGAKLIVVLWRNERMGKPNLRPENLETSHIRVYLNARINKYVAYASAISTSTSCTNSNIDLRLNVKICMRWRTWLWASATRRIAVNALVKE